MMTWIKSHPAQTAVIALSLSLAGSSVELYREYSSFRPRAIAMAAPAPGIERLTLDSATLDNALVAARAPGVWRVDGPKPPRLFASQPYVAVRGQLQRPEGKMFHPGVLNNWLLKHGLDALDPHVLKSDPDKDGFTTLQEWEGMDARSHLDVHGKPVIASGGRQLDDDSNSPVDPADHPPYHTRLFLERVEQIPFHLRFLTHDTNARNPRQITVQINAEPGRTEYVDVGESLKSAPFDVRSIERKESPGPDGTTIDTSELVVVDRRTGEAVTLPIGKVVNSPESYAILRYDWPAAGAKEQAKFRLRKNETFRLPPENQVYRVAEIRLDGVDLVCPSGDIHTIARK